MRLKNSKKKKLEKSESCQDDRHESRMADGTSRDRISAPVPQVTVAMGE